MYLLSAVLESDFVFFTLLVTIIFPRKRKIYIRPIEKQQFLAENEF